MYSANKYLVHSNMSCQRQIISECQVGCPIRKSADQSSFAAPHGLSQRITSFIASYRQGIHQTPFSRLIRSSERSTRPSFTDHHLPSVRTRQSRTDMVSALDLERLLSLLAMPNTSNATRPRPDFCPEAKPDRPRAARRPTGQHKKASRVSLSSQCQTVQIGQESINVLSNRILWRLARLTRPG